eukprot:362944-Chlamydomonas_euryale.AAC.4
MLSCGALLRSHHKQCPRRGQGTRAHAGGSLWPACSARPPHAVIDTKSPGHAQGGERAQGVGACARGTQCVFGGMRRHGGGGEGRIIWQQEASKLLHPKD